MWHEEFDDSAYVFVGNVPPQLSEGDLIAVLSQYGTVVDLNMPRDATTGQSRSIAFAAYEDQRSTVLAVDNLHAITLLGRRIRCEHCKDYRHEKTKDEQNIPQKLRARLTDEQLLDKKRAIAERNDELREDARVKAARFAEGRGTADTADQLEEKEVRAEVIETRERDADRRRREHIDGVLQRHKRAPADGGERAPRVEGRHWRARAPTAGEASREAMPPPPAVLPAAAHDESLEAAGEGGSVDRAWARLARGGGLKLKKPRRDGAPSDGATERPREQKRPGEQSASVEETNAMRASLGMKPLKM